MEEYADDPDIGACEVIWRRVPPGRFLWDDALARFRPQTGMFSDSRDGSPMSGGRAKCYESSKGLLEGAGYPDHLLVAFRVDDLRGLGLRIASWPPTEDPGHVWIVGKKTAGRQKKLARMAEWVVTPDPANAPK